MIYCVYNNDSYKEDLSCGLKPKIKGRRDGDPGGSVWKTYEEALDFAWDEFSVFGVLADWERDTVPDVRGFWNCLLVDAVIVRLDDDATVELGAEEGAKVSDESLK